MRKTNSSYLIWYPLEHTYHVFHQKQDERWYFVCEMQFLKHYIPLLAMMVVCCKDSKRRGTFWVESLASVFSQEDFWIALCNANYHIFCKKVHFLNSSKHEKAFVRSLFKLSQWEEESTVWTEGFLCKDALPPAQDFTK